MTNKQDVIDLYNDALFFIQDPEDTVAHLSSKEDAEAYGAYLSLLMSRLGVESTVCDIGCGTCSPLRCYKGDIKSLNYIALDINTNMISRAKERWKNYNNIKFGLYDITACNIPNYDIILINETFSYFNSKEINAMIDYYACKANKVLSISILDGSLSTKTQNKLLISQRDPISVISYCLSKYSLISVDRACYPCRYRIDIFQDQKYYDLVKGLERRPYLGKG